MPTRKLRIPKDYLGGFTEFILLPEENMRLLITELEQLEIISNVNASVEQLSVRIRYPQDKVSSIVEMLVSLFANFGFASQKLDVDALTKDLTVSCQEMQIAPPDYDWGVFQRNLAQILKAKDGALAILAQAFRIAAENEKTMLGSELITEIRPVFDTKHDSPRSNVIIHRLVLKYMQNDDEQEFHVALDHGDLENLLEQIKASVRKEELVKSQLSKWKQSVFDYYEF